MGWTGGARHRSSLERGGERATAGRNTRSGQRAVVDQRSGICDGWGVTTPVSATAAVRADFEAHLRQERNHSPHTVRAYLADLDQLGDYLAERGVDLLQ